MDPQRARNERFQQQDAEESRQHKGHDGQGLEQARQARNKCADIPPTRREIGSCRIAYRIWGLQFGRSLTTFLTNSVNSRTSSSVVSNEHIHRTTDSSSLHT